jgi:hypothetical protein
VERTRLQAERMKQVGRKLAVVQISLKHCEELRLLCEGVLLALHARRFAGWQCV